MRFTLKAEASGGARQALRAGGRTDMSTARRALFVNEDLNEERDERADDLPESSGRRSISFGT